MLCLVCLCRRALNNLLNRLPNPVTLLNNAASAVAGAGAATAVAIGTQAASSTGQSDQKQQASPTTAPGAAAGSSEPTAGEQDHQAGVPPAPAGPCPLCGSTELLLPLVALPCQHVFCYYCLRSNCAADKDFECPWDGQRVEAMRRWRPAQRARGAAAGDKKG